MKNLKYLDTNIILRYLLQDHHSLSQEASIIIENENIFIANEVLAEVIYVLNKTYKVDKKELSQTLIAFLYNENIYLLCKEVAIAALEYFSEKNIDFVDCLLCAYRKINSYEVISFDKNLVKCLKHNPDNSENL